MAEICDHKFRVDKAFLKEPIVQFLTCTKCDERFFGFDGVVGKPIVIHPIRKPMHEKQFEDMLYNTISVDIKVKP